MTIDIKAAAAQLCLVSFSGSCYSKHLEKLMSGYGVGGVIHFLPNIPPTSSQLISMNRQMREAAIAATGLPPFITVDEEGGRVSRLRQLIGKYPSQLELSAMAEEAAVESYRQMLIQVRNLGFNITWSPLLDINSNTENPVIGDRAFGDSVDVVMRLGKMMLRTTKEVGMFSSGKHFPGHGDTCIDSHFSLPTQDTDIALLLEREVKPFLMAVGENVDFLMTAHILFTEVDDELPVSFSPIWIEDILRQRLGYDGIVITDDLNMGAVQKNYELKERIRLAITAGADMLLIRDDEPEAIEEFVETVVAMAESGELPPERVEQSFNRVKKLKLSV